MNLENLNIFLKLGLLLFIVLLMSFVAAELIRQRLTRKRKLIISLCGSFILTGYTFFFLGGHSLLFTQEGLISSKILSFKKQISPLEKKATAFFDSSFIFIDTGLNLSLQPVYYREDSTFLAITDRKKLAALLHFLSDHKEMIQLVAVDLVFQQAGDDDTLFNAIYPLQKAGKLVMAFDNRLIEENNNFYKQIDKSSLADVSNPDNEPVVYSHTITGNLFTYSFPYLMYCKLQHTNAQNEQDSFFVFNNFISSFYVNDEKKLYNDSTFNLGFAISKEGNDTLLHLIQNIYSAHQQAVVFIGNLRDDYIDMHHTAFGQYHGSFILLNQLYSLIQHTHRMQYMTLCYYILFLFTCFSLILYYILYRADRKDVRNPRSAATTHYLIDWITSVGDFILDQSWYLLLLAMAVLIDLIFNKLINIVGLIYILPLFSTLLKYFINRKNQQGSSTTSP